MCAFMYQTLSLGRRKETVQSTFTLLCSIEQIPFDYNSYFHGFWILYLVFGVKKRVGEGLVSALARSVSAKLCLHGAIRAARPVVKAFLCTIFRSPHVHVCVSVTPRMTQIFWLKITV